MSEWTPAWETNATAEELAAIMRSAKRVTCLTHGKPDGDAAGSTLAIARSMRQAGVDARICYVGPAPRWLAEVAGGTPFEVATPGVQARPSHDGEPDLIVITDTGSWTQLADVREWLTGKRDRVIIMDHHLHGDGEIARWRYIQQRDAASTQVIAPVCEAILGVPAAKFPIDVATPLYLGLATDTQWFRLSNVTPPTMRLGADLLEAGVNHTGLYEIIEQRDTPGRWKLMGRALSSLELIDNGRVAMMHLTLKDFDESGADRNDTGGFADMVQHIESVRVAVVLTESDTAPGEPPVTKVSMRSKPGANAVDVNALTRKLGGGGHARAAGAKMIGVDIAEARRRVISLVQE